MLILLALALAAVTTPQPGVVKTFKDWTVACDNIRSCSAVALLPEEGSGDDYQSVSLTRSGAARSVVTISIDAGARPAGARVELFVDGAMVQALGTAADGNFKAMLDAAALARMANGTKAELRVGGKSVGTVSLAGFAAAMRYWDAQQVRDGSPDAVVAKGKAAGTVAPPPAPRIVAARIPPGTATAPSSAVVKMLAKRFGCEDEQDGPGEIEAHRLAANSVLILLPCGAGAYNFSSVPIVATGTGKATTYAFAAFDLSPRWGGEGANDPTLVNAGFDAKTATLSSYAKGRGPGDCGSSQTWVWDGTRFRLTEMREMSECRGSIEWMRTWTATVVR